MTEVWISAILFGFVHPGSKWIMHQGIGLMPFCILYIGFRLIMQLLISLKTGSYRISSARKFALLATFGIVGACLQLSEFVGISKGLPVPVVTFLVYSHPVWTLLLSRLINSEKLKAVAFVKLTIATIGIALITQVNDYNLQSDWLLYFWPLCAGLLISIWICLSQYASKASISASTMSLFYDLFSFVAILIISTLTDGGQSVKDAAAFITSPSHFFQMAFYSIFVGFLPNILFYKGSLNVGAFAAGMILLLEPVVSSTVSWLVWSDHLSWMFLLGATLILVTNIPETVLIRLRYFRIRSPAPASTTAGTIILFFLFTGPHSQGGTKKELHLLELTPPGATDYTVTQELIQIRTAAELAIVAHKKMAKRCSVAIEFDIRHGSEEELFSKVKTLSQSKDQVLVVGLSRSDFARLAAKAAQGTQLRAISIGAATSQLHSINPNFASIASPWEKQWSAISGELSKEGCNFNNTIALYDRRSLLSSNFIESFLNEHRGTAFNIASTNSSSFASLAQHKQCAFIGVNFSDAEQYLQSLINRQWSGLVLGIGDWNFFGSELRATLKKGTKNRMTALIPTGWLPTINSRSRKFGESILSLTSRLANPVGAYTYDAVLLGLDSLCNNRSPTVFNNSRMKDLPLVRKYFGISRSGNFLSTIHILRIKSGE